MTSFEKVYLMKENQMTTDSTRHMKRVSFHQLTQHHHHLLTKQLEKGKSSSFFDQILNAFYELLVAYSVCLFYLLVAWLFLPVAGNAMPLACLMPNPYNIIDDCVYYLVQVF